MHVEVLLAYMGRTTVLHLLPIVGLAARRAQGDAERNALRYLHAALSHRLAELELEHADRPKAAA
jgi:hypothetical protein